MVKFLLISFLLASTPVTPSIRAALAQSAANKSESIQLEEKFSKALMAVLFEDGKSKLNSKANRGCNRETLGKYLSALFTGATETPARNQEISFKCSHMDKKPEIYEKYLCNFQVAVGQRGMAGGMTKGVHYVVVMTEKGPELDISTVACTAE